MAHTSLFHRYQMYKAKFRLVQIELGHIDYMLEKMQSDSSSISIDQLTLDAYETHTTMYSASNIQDFRNSYKRYQHLQYMISRLLAEPGINKDILKEEKEQFQSLLAAYEKKYKDAAKIFKTLGLLFVAGATALTIHNGMVMNRRLDIAHKHAEATGQQIKTPAEKINSNTLDLLKQIIAKDYNISDPSSIVIQDDSTQISANSNNPQSGYIIDYSIKVRQPNGSLVTLAWYKGFRPSGDDGPREEIPEEGSTMLPEHKHLLDAFSSPLHDDNENESSRTFYQVYDVWDQTFNGEDKTNSSFNNEPETGLNNNSGNYLDER